MVVCLRALPKIFFRNFIFDVVLNRTMFHYPMEVGHPITWPSTKLPCIAVSPGFFFCQYNLDRTDEETLGVAHIRKAIDDYTNETKDFTLQGRG